MLQRPTARRKKPYPKLLLLVIVVCAAAACWQLLMHNDRSPSSSNQNAKGGQNQPGGFDKKQYSLDDPTSPWVVVNKKRPLDPISYTPSDLAAPAVPLRNASTDPGMQIRAKASARLEQLVAAAKNEDVNLMLASGYRTYDTQAVIYASEVLGFGQAQADKESARPGHSEHQTGWAADLAPTNGKCVIEACFADTTEGKWLAANAYKYGFILRYTPGKEAITGYDYEPWHIRYIGTDLAAEMHHANVQTLEEFFNLPDAPDY